MSVTLRGARVVVTGSSGFMGTRLIARLRAEGAHVLGAALDAVDGEEDVAKLRIFQRFFVIITREAPSRLRSTFLPILAYGRTY